ncbi:MAG: recombinase family protein [Clostridiales bacterium]|nr:recombinase family protein [Clostridiales bacterium]
MVKRAFELYAGEPSMSLTGVSRVLTQEGYQLNGKNCWAGTLSRIFHNPVYAVADDLLYTYYKGKQIHFLNDQTCWNGETSAAIVGKTKSKKRVKEEQHTIYLTNIKGIIDSSSFILVQERLSRNRSFGRANPANTKMKELSGLVKCAKCGYAVKMKSQYPTLSCDGRSRLHICDASFRGIRLEAIQKQVEEYCQAWLDDSCHKMAQDEKKREMLKTRAASLETEIHRLVNLAAVNESFSAAAVKDVEMRQKELNEVNLELSFETANGIVKEVFDQKQVEGHRLLYRDLSEENKKILCRGLIERILLFENGQVQVVAKGRDSEN